MIRIAAWVPLMAVVAGGCAGDKPVPPPTPAATTAPPTTEPAGTTTTAGGAEGDIGVPECDEFARKYLACLETVPQSGRAMIRQTFDQVRAHWKRVAADPARRATLASACRQHEELTKKTLERYRCQW